MQKRRTKDEAKRAALLPRTNESETRTYFVDQTRREIPTVFPLGLQTFSNHTAHLNEQKYKQIRKEKQKKTADQTVSRLINTDKHEVKQAAQLSQRDRAMLHDLEHFTKSLKITGNDNLDKGVSPRVFQEKMHKICHTINSGLFVLGL